MEEEKSRPKRQKRYKQRPEFRPEQCVASLSDADERFPVQVKDQAHHANHHAAQRLRLCARRRQKYTRRQDAALANRSVHSVRGCPNYKCTHLLISGSRLLWHL